MQITRAERVRLWLPAAAWAAMILILSGEGGSSTASGGLLRLLFPTLSADTFDALNFALRKVSHVVAYAVLSLLCSGAQQGTGTRRRAVAVLLAAIVAMIDEIHQSRAATRSGHASDVLLDSVAAAGAQVVVWMRSRRYP